MPPRRGALEKPTIMQTRHALIALGLTLLLGAGAYLALIRSPGEAARPEGALRSPSDRASTSLAPVDGAAAPPPATGAPAPAERTERFDALLRSGTGEVTSKPADFYTASNVDEALNWLDRADLDDPTRLRLEKSLADACPPGGLELEAERQEWIAERLDAWCAGFSFDAAEQEAIQRQFLGTISAGAESIAADMAGLSMAEQEDYLREAIAAAESWTDLEAIKVALEAAYYLAPASDRQDPMRLHQLGQDPGYVGEQGQRIQRNALTLLQCVDYVDCGPDSIFTLQECFSRPICEPGWSLYDLLYNTTSPLEDEQVMAVLEQLLGLRRGG